MFSPAYWNNFDMYGGADDGYGNYVSLSNSAWEVAWNTTYTGCTEGSLNRSYPILEELH